jgi:dTDP-4-amino-4,6-dideoxygalactose transaminase
VTAITLRWLQAPFNVMHALRRKNVQCYKKMLTEFQRRNGSEEEEEKKIEVHALVSIIFADEGFFQRKFVVG